MLHSGIAQDSQARQLDLPLAHIHRSAPHHGTSKEKSRFNDPAFASNKNLPVHRWVPWIAGFSSDFVRDALRKCAYDNATILDPFAGVGTTLIEAILLGYHAVGFEINPYAALASRVKTLAYKVDAGTLHDYIGRCKQFYDENAASGSIPQSHPPEGFKTRSAFYHPEVLHKVLIFQDFIATIDNAQICDIFRLAFASTMVTYSNYSYEPSLGKRTSAGKNEILDYPVGETILGKLSQIREDIKWFQQHIPKKNITIKILHDSFFRYSACLPPESVDVIVTSPPYLNNYHYNRNTRPQLYWLGYATRPQDLKRLEESNFGKYWQTVREQKCIRLGFSLSDVDLEERLETIRKHRPEKGIYGGNGWANYAASYFNDCYTFALGMKYVLKPGGTALVVLGNSILQGIFIATDQYFGKIAESVGLELVRIDIPRKTRVGNSIIQSNVRTVKARKSHQLYEAIVELRKS